MNNDETIIELTSKYDDLLIKYNTLLNKYNKMSKLHNKKLEELNNINMMISGGHVSISNNTLN